MDRIEWTPKQSFVARRLPSGGCEREKQKRPHLLGNGDCGREREGAAQTTQGRAQDRRERGSADLPDTALEPVPEGIMLGRSFLRRRNAPFLWPTTTAPQDVSVLSIPKFGNEVAAQ